MCAAKPKLPLKFNTQYKHNTKVDGDFTSLETILPTFSRDPFADYEWCNNFPNIPFRYIVCP